jgi:hypothetical protein
MSNPGRPQDVWKNSAAGNKPTAGNSGTQNTTRKRWFAAALFVVLLGGTLAGLLVYLWPDPTPTLLAIPVTAYENPDWSPNPFAESDARGFLERAGGESAQAFQAQEKELILRELARVASSSRSRPLVVYISALGVSDGGKVSLIPSGGQPDKPETWLPLEEILSPLRRTAAPRLLILDIRPVTDPRAVLTGEDVNESLDATLARLTKAGDLPFFVLTANTPAEGANVLRPLHRTTFGLALAQGAGGEADGWNPDRKRDGRVSVRELAAYVRELTNHASLTAGLPPQLPQLHGTADDFDVFHVPRGGPPALPVSADAEPYPDYLQAAWKDRDAWIADSLQLRAPRVVRQFGLTTSRAERRWMAGGNLETIKANFDTFATRLREVRTTLTSVVQPAASVARALRKPGVNQIVARDALQSVFNRILEAPGPDRDKALTQAIAVVGDKPPDAEPFDATAAAIFSFARNLEKPTHDQMKQLATLISRIKPRPRHAELVTISLIGELPAEQVEKWPSQTVRVLLEVAALAEEAVACDGRCLPWIKTDLAKADETRRKALRDLCDPKSPEKVRRAAVTELEAVRSDYTAVRGATVALMETRTEHEETRAVLADLAVNFPTEAATLPEVAAKTWSDLTEDFMRVKHLLTVPAQPRLPDSGVLGLARQSLRANRLQLMGLLRVPDSGSVRQLESLLRWRAWSQPERAKLLSTLASTDQAAARKVLEHWPKEPPAREATAPESKGRTRAIARETTLRWLAVLRMADAKGIDDLDARVRGERGSEPTEVARNASLVREAVRRQFPSEYATTDPVRQAAIGWAVDTDDAPAFPQQKPTGPPNPELPDQRAAEAEFHEWLARTRYAADAAILSASVLKPVQDAGAMYREIGRTYADSVR